jgi:hypothetical protein
LEFSREDFLIFRKCPLRFARLGAQQVTGGRKASSLSFACPVPASPVPVGFSPHRVRLKTTLARCTRHKPTERKAP